SPVQCAEHEWLARPHIDAPEIERHAARLERILYQIMLTHGGTAGGDDNIWQVCEDRLEPSIEQCRVVPDYPMVDDHIGIGRQQGRQPKTIRCNDLVRT